MFCWIERMIPCYRSKSFRMFRSWIFLWFYSLLFLLVRWQHTGPEYAGPLGILQALADGTNLHLKENILPLRGNGLFSIGPSIASIAILLSFSVIPFSSRLTLADLNISIFMDFHFRYCYKVFAANFSGFEFSSLVFSLLGNLKRRIICLSYIYCKVPSVSIARFSLKFGGASVVGNLKMACCVSRTCLEIMLGMVLISVWNIWHGKLVREFPPPPMESWDCSEEQDRWFDF